MRNRCWKQAVLLLAASSVITLGLACGKPKIPKPQPSIPIAVEGQATPTINRDFNGDPNSVVVRVYHLKDKVEFAKLTFDLATSGRTDQELLGADFLGRSEFVAVPGTTFLEKADLTAGTRYIGVVAFFRKPDPHYWRYIVSLDQLKIARSKKKDWKTKKLPIFSFKVQDCYMTVNYIRPDYIPGQPENAKPECTGYFLSAPPPRVKTTQPAVKPLPTPAKPVSVPTKPTVPKSSKPTVTLPKPPGT